MGKDKHVIWTNDSSTRESEEKYIKGDWINEVRAKLGLGDSNETWVPSSLVDAVKEAAIDAAIEKAVGRDEETINFIEAYRDFAQEENIEEIIDERFYDELDEGSMRTIPTGETARLQTFPVSIYISPSLSSKTVTMGTDFSMSTTHIK